MPKKTPNLQTLYLSERIREIFRHIRTHALTAVVAPMGYGKTTALNQYLAEQEEQGAVVLRLSIYSDNSYIFWHQLQNAFSTTDVYEEVKKLEFPENKTGLLFFMETMEKYFHTHHQEHFLFIDDFHLLTSENATEFLYEIAKNTPPRFHLIVASRNSFVSKKAELELGNRFYAISQEDLRLNFTEIVSYAKGCGVALPEDITEQLFEMSEGWFSGVYLCLRGYLESGFIPTQTGSIYDMMDEVLLEPMPEDERMFIIKLCLADEFTTEMAEYLNEIKGVKKRLEAAARGNAFITLLPDMVHYRFHHILKECTRRRFDALDKDTRALVLRRYGQWYEEHALYAKAMEAYRGAEDWEGLFSVIGKDQAMELTYFSQETVTGWINDCPEDELRRDPLALLVLMKQYFSWRLIPEMQKMRSEFLKAVEESTTLDEEDKNNLLGECEMVMSFTAFNSIEKMSEYHQSARKKMNRPALTMGRRGTWTFGSPTILSMYHREIGRLDDEIETMHRSMPYYYALTEGHGMGAEYIMEAEAMFLRGDLKKARVALEEARFKVEEIHDKEKEMRFILLCIFFVDLQLLLLGETGTRDSVLAERLSEKDGGAVIRDWYAVEAEAIRQFRSPMLLTTLDLIAAWGFSIIGLPERIPAWIKEGGVEQANILFPAKPIALIIQNQVHMAMGDHAAVISGKDAVSRLCQVYPYLLCSLMLELQLAESYRVLGQTDEAREHAKVAAEIAEPDGLILPFAMIIGSEDILPQSIKEKAHDWCEKISAAASEYRDRIMTPEAISGLTGQEQQVALLMAQGKKNKEIASELFLSEGTVKQYINRIYGKLDLTGTSAEKRDKLRELLKY